MEPKEKAKEIFDSIYTELRIETSGTTREILTATKNISLSFASEIIKAYYQSNKNYEMFFGLMTFDNYWNEVKQEIEKL